MHVYILSDMYAHIYVCIPEFILFLSNIYIYKHKKYVIFICIMHIHVFKKKYLSKVIVIGEVPRHVPPACFFSKKSKKNCSY